MEEHSRAENPSRRGRRFRLLGIAALLLIVLVVAAPTIIAKTSLRDWLINAIIGADNLSASTDAASLGWFSPLAVEGVQINGVRERFQLHVDRIAAEQSWPKLLATSPDLGAITVESPHVRVLLPLEVQLERDAPTLPLPNFDAVVRDAGLTVSSGDSADPLIEVDDFDVTVHVKQVDDGHVLTVDPVDVFTRKTLTPELCSRLLHLMNPSMRDPAQVEGEFSLSLDKLSVPLGVPESEIAERFEVEGELALHQVSLDAQSPMLEAVVKLLSDTNRIEAPEAIRIVKDAVVKFSAKDGRLFHEGLELGFPDIDANLQIASSGSVGLDGTLDLHLELPRLDEVKRREFGPVLCHVTGDLDAPELSVKNASLVVRGPDRDKALIDLDGVDLVMRVEDSPAGRVLTVDPFDVFKLKKIDRELASGLIELIEPGIEYSPNLAGEASLSIQSLRIPLGAPREDLLKNLELQGKLAIHEATTAATDPTRQAIVKLLADLYGKEPTEVVRIAQDAEIDFRVQDGRVHYDGLALGFPDIDPDLIVTSRGSVGLDETLDLEVQLPRLDKAKLAEQGPVQCRITGTVSNPVLSVKNASLVVHGPDRDKALIDLDGVDLVMRVADSPAGRVLTVEPFDVFERKKIDRELASGLIELIEPGIEYSPKLAGEASLSIQSLRIPLGASREDLLKGLELHGKLSIHEATTAATDPTRQAIVKLLADLYGKEPTEVVRIAQDAEIDFRVQDGRVHYDGLALGFPDIDPDLIVTSRGSVGLDETLDLEVQLPRLDKAKLAEEGPVECRITGTVSNPVLSVKNASLVVRLPEFELPLLDIGSVDMVMKVATDRAHRMLVAEPFKIFDNKQITAAKSDQILRLAAPTLGDLTDVEGQITLIIETLRIPLGAPREQLVEELELTGRLQLHDVSATVETPLATTVVKALASLYGQQPPDVVRVIKDADVPFELRNGRLYQEDMSIGFPDISPELMGVLHGSVGLDKTLDVVLEVPSVLSATDDASEDGKPDLIRMRISGTIDNPTVVQMED